MTDKELKKLKKHELLELLVYMKEANEKLKAENIQLKENLEEAQKNRELLEKIYRAVAKEQDDE